MANVKISGIANQESTSVTDTDLFEGEEAGGTSFKVAFSVMKSTIKTYTDTLYQALDATLTALAGLASAANKIPYFTGSDTASMLDFKDEDDMASNSATALPSQQSVKAYVDVTAGAGTFKNLIINGDMQISQRGTSETGITGITYTYRKAPDRWKFATGATSGTWTVSQATSPIPTGFGYSYGFQCTAANPTLAAGDYVFIEQHIEGQFLQHIKKGTASAEQLTVSFWARSNKTGTYVAELYDTDNTRHVAASYTINAANTWEYKTLTFAADTTGAFTNDSNVSLRVVFWLAAGSTYTTGTLPSAWAAVSNPNRAAGQLNLADTINNNFYISGVQLEVGASATNFERLPWDVQLARCRRYYQKSFPYATVPATGAGYTGAQTLDCLGASVYTRVTVAFVPAMRIGPTVTLYNPVNANAQVFNVTRLADCSNSTGTLTTEYNALLYAMSPAGGVLSDYQAVHWAADAEL